MADRYEGVAGFTLFPDIAASYQPNEGDATK